MLNVSFIFTMLSILFLTDFYKSGQVRSRVRNVNLYSDGGLKVIGIFIF